MTAPRTPAADVLAVLAAIDAGEVTVTRLFSDNFPRVDVDYEASNGWRFRVFDDAGDWDYVDAFCAPGGEWTDVDGEDYLTVLWWTPTGDRATWMRQWSWDIGGTSPGGYRL